MYKIIWRCSIQYNSFFVYLHTESIIANWSGYTAIKFLLQLAIRLYNSNGKSVISLTIVILQYACQSTSLVLGIVNLTENHSVYSNGSVPKICSLLPASKISCTVTAVNAAGESPSVSSVGYTRLKCEFKNKFLVYTVCFI